MVINNNNNILVQASQALDSLCNFNDKMHKNQDFSYQKLNDEEARLVRNFSNLLTSLLKFNKYINRKNNSKKTKLKKINSSTLYTETGRTVVIQEKIHSSFIKTSYSRKNLDINI